MADEIYLTNDGAANLRAELDQLKGPKRNEIAKRLRSAIQMGDLSENADYKQAKDDQGFLEGRIQEIEYLLRNATIIEGAASTDVVGIGNHVTIEEEGSSPETYHIVGAKEADPRKGKISNESPIGQALAGHRVGDWVEVSTPGGGLRLRIVKIE